MGDDQALPIMGTLDDTKAFLKTALDFQRTLHRMRFFLPNNSVSEIVTITGSVERAASEFLKKGSRAKSKGKRKPHKARKKREGGPFLRERMIAAMGDKVMSLGDITEACIKRGWSPKTAVPRNAISAVIAMNQPKKMFLKVPSAGRGHYQVSAKYRKS